MFKNLSIKIQITLIGGISMILAVLIIISYISYSIQKEAISQAKQNVLNTAKNNSLNIKVILQSANTVVNTIKDVLETNINNKEKMSRSQVVEILKKTIASNHNFIGSSTIWEPNAFDGKDEAFKNIIGHNKTGRFMPYVYRDSSGIITEPISDDLSEADYYQLAKKTKKTVLTEPYFYLANNEYIFMVTISTPILVADKFYGVVTVDITLNKLQQIADNLDIYDKTGKGTLISYKGKIVASTNKLTLLGKSLKEAVPINYEQGIELVKNAKEFVSYDRKRKYFFAYAPMQIKNIETPWSFFIKVPEKNVMEHSQKMLFQVISISIILGLIVLTLFWLSLHKIINPLLSLLELKTKKLQNSLTELKQTQEQVIEKEKMAALGGLVAGVAHEINTPIGIALTGITHFSDITESLEKNYKLNNMSEDEFGQYLTTSKELSKQIHVNLKRTTHLVRSFKQIAVDQTNESKRIFNLKEYFDNTVFSLKNILKQTNLKINIKSKEDIIIDSYPGAYSQIIANLILNSIRHGYYAKEKGDITIDIIRENNNLQINYRDDGKGITKENLPKIFDPFFTTNREHGSTGLGLNIIYNIITSTLNGNIKCNSEEGHGIEFIINIPLT